MFLRSANQFAFGFTNIIANITTSYNVLAVVNLTQTAL
jgi:hypothetical protein